MCSDLWGSREGILLSAFGFRIYSIFVWMQIILKTLFVWTQIFFTRIKKDAFSKISGCGGGFRMFSKTFKRQIPQRVSFTVLKSQTIMANGFSLRIGLTFMMGCTEPRFYNMHFLMTFTAMIKSYCVKFLKPYLS